MVVKITATDVISNICCSRNVDFISGNSTLSLGLAFPRSVAIALLCFSNLSASPTSQARPPTVYWMSTRPATDIGLLQQKPLALEAMILSSINETASWLKSKTETEIADLLEQGLRERRDKR